MISYLHAGFERSVHLCFDGDNLSNPVKNNNILWYVIMQGFEPALLGIPDSSDENLFNQSMFSILYWKCTEKGLALLFTRQTFMYAQ